MGHCTYSTAEDRLFCFNLLLQNELSEAKRIYPNRTSLQTVVNGLESAESDCKLPCKSHNTSAMNLYLHLYPLSTFPNFSSI